VLVKPRSQRRQRPPLTLGIGVLWQDAVLLAHLSRSDSSHCLSTLRLRYIAGPMLD